MRIKKTVQLSINSNLIIRRLLHIYPWICSLIRDIFCYIVLLPIFNTSIYVELVPPEENKVQIMQNVFDTRIY